MLFRDARHLRVRGGTAMEPTAYGMAEAIVMPAKRPKYEFADAGMVASTIYTTSGRTARCPIGRGG